MRGGRDWAQKAGAPADDRSFLYLVTPIFCCGLFVYLCHYGYYGRLISLDCGRPDWINRLLSLFTQLMIYSYSILFKRRTTIYRLGS